MDPNKDFEKAIMIINHYTMKLGLKDEYELKIEDRLNDCAKPSSSLLKFDKQYFKALSEREFRAVVVHELGHIKTDQVYNITGILLFLGIYIILLVLLRPQNLSSVLQFFGVCIILLIIIIRCIHRKREFTADEIAKEKRDLYGLSDIISAIDKAKCKYNNTSYDKLFNILKSVFPHPSPREREKRLTR